MASSSHRRRIIGVSLKMYFSVVETRAYLDQFKELSYAVSTDNIDLVVIPDFLGILDASRTLSDTNVMLGAQDCFWEDSGAYTGEISPATLREAGCRVVEIGHAERRQIFGETDEQVASKVKAAVRNGLIPLVCVGEKTRSSIASEGVGLAIRECVPQVKAVLDALPEEQEVIFAYEPFWAIGQSKPASTDHVVAVTQELRKMTAHRKGLTRILYGGSAGPGTFQALKDGVDGLFLGRSGHDIGALRAVIAEMSGS